LIKNCFIADSNLGSLDNSFVGEFQHPPLESLGFPPTIVTSK